MSVIKMPSTNLQWATAQDKHLLQIMSWFPNERSVVMWGGPNIRFPFTEQTFKEDIKLKDIATYTIVDESENPLAFGQIYPRLGRCHLGRLAVNPDNRRQGLGQRLIASLCEIGNQTLNTQGYSLFVLSDNNSALNLYQKLGFRQAEYPKPLTLDNCLYLIKDED
ncbi:MAG: GNAT family N-acetyltransferase [Kangiellaceae bacterium]|nr:GNAT family N-acetyltransferase [Kangiellaceae bacterium]